MEVSFGWRTGESQHILDLRRYCGDLIVCEEDYLTISELEMRETKATPKFSMLKPKAVSYHSCSGPKESWSPFPTSSHYKSSLVPGTQDNWRFLLLLFVLLFIFWASLRSTHFPCLSLCTPLLPPTAKIPPFKHSLFCWGTSSVLF